MDETMGFRARRPGRAGRRVGGHRDELVNPELATALAQRIPGATLNIRDGGHFVAHRHYREIFEALRVSRGRCGGRRTGRPFGECFVVGGGQVDVGDRHAAPGPADATTHPSGSTMALPSVHRWPRSSPVRSQQATAILLVRAVDIAVMTSPGRSPSGRGNSGQFTGAAINSAPSSATRRVSSPNSMSKQTIIAISPCLVLTTGGSASPGVKINFSLSHRWVLR